MQYNTIEYRQTVPTQNTNILKVRYSDVSVIQMFIFEIPTVYYK